MLRKARRHARAVRRASGGYIFGRPFRVNTITTKKIAAGPIRLRFSTHGVAPLILQANLARRRTQATFLRRPDALGECSRA